MTRRRIATTTSVSLVALWPLIIGLAIVTVELMLAITSNADEHSAAPSVTDWECAAAAAEYQHFGNIKGVPMSLIEGEL